ncbi:MAG: PAS domain S-box protein [Vicinamibacterales bacterium]
MLPDPAERALLYLAAIVEFSDDAIISKDLEGTITSWNRAATRMFGYDASEAVGRSIRMLIPAERQQEEDDTLARLRRGQVVDHFETVRVRKDGTELDISLTVSPIRAADGRIIGASKIARDITAQKRTAAALAETEARRADLQQRLLVLTSASGTLLGSLRREDLLPAILSLASNLITADWYAVWRLDQDTGVWAIVSHVGLSTAFAATRAVVRPGAKLEFTDLLVAEDVSALDVLEERRAAYGSEGIQSMLAIPLPIGGHGVASLVFYYRRRHAFDDVEVQTARALGNLAAAALNTVELYDEQRRSELQARFLADVGATLARSLDSRQALKALASLAVPDIADWCAIDIVRSGRHVERVAIAHADPAKVAMAEEFRRRYPSDASAPYSPERVIATGSPAMLAYLSDEMVVEGASDPEHLEAVRRSASRPSCASLSARGRA